MHSTSRTDSRTRRAIVIASLAALPLLAVACASPAGPTDVGAGAGGQSSSTTSSSDSAPDTASSGDPSAPDSSTSGEVGSGTSSSTGTQEPSASSTVPASLVGSSFTSAKITGRAAVKDKPLTISFDASGKSTGLNAGCNSMGGEPVFDGDSLSIPQIVSTMMACEDGGGVIMKQESWYSDWLKKGVSYTLKGSVLTLTGQGVTVVYERSADDPDSSTSSDGSGIASVGPAQTDSSPSSGASITTGSVGSAIPIPSTDK